MNDTRMVPAAGPSDEEIRDFVMNYGIARDFEPSDAVYMIQAALAKWGAQPECDAKKVEALILDLNRYGGAGPGFGGICQRHDGKYLLMEDVLAALRSSRRPKGRVVEGWMIVNARNGKLLTFYEKESVARDALLIPFSQNHKVARCRIEILDAPEEG